MLLTACRTDDIIIYAEDEDTGVKAVTSEVIGMYILNEGNMGSNKCTLDYLDLSGNDSTIHYNRNIFAERNPNEVKELGDVGNDIKIYGSRLWLVINCSNKVEVCRAADAVKIGKVDIPNCRYVTFDGGYAYVSSYVGPVAIDGNAPRGRVYKVDTLTLQKVDSVVVDLASFTEERQIDVAVNLHRCRADKYGQLWVTTRGDYYDNPSGLCWLQSDNNGQMQLKGRMDMPVSDMCIVGDSLYYLGAEFNYATANYEQSLGIINVRTHEIVTTHLAIPDAYWYMEQPYGIIVHPTNHDFYLMDAKNFVSSGSLLHFNADGSFDYMVRTGDIPGHAVFLMKDEK